MADTTTDERQLADAPEVAEALEAVRASRRGMSDELDELAPALRRSLDFPTKIRRNPVRTAGIVGGATFLLLGGPRRVASAVEKRFFPRRAERPPTLLPKDVDKALDRLEPGERERVHAHLERDFAAYIKKEHPREPKDARRSLWNTYDVLLATVGARAAQELVKRLFESPDEMDRRSAGGDEAS